jgi:hypothetical protein
MNDIFLNDTWILYDHEKSNNDDYEKSTRILGNFNTVFGFWTYYNGLPLPSKLFYQTGIGKPYYDNDNGTREVSSISLFRKGILPKWEDPKNINGGEFALRKFFKKNMSYMECLDDIWVTLSMFCISEESKYYSYINGVRVVDSSLPKKPLYRIELWFSDLSVKDKIEQEFKIVLGLTEYDKIYFKSHKTDNGFAPYKPEESTQILQNNS